MTQPHIVNIAIAGASGIIGKVIVDHLLRGGKHNITALTRAGSKTKLPEGVKIADVDYEDKSSLITALKGQDALLVCLSVIAPAGTENRLIDAAAEAGVQWIAPNVWSVDYQSNPELRKVSFSHPNLQVVNQF